MLMFMNLTGYEMGNSLFYLWHAFLLDRHKVSYHYETSRRHCWPQRWRYGTINDAVTHGLY